MLKMSKFPDISSQSVTQRDIEVAKLMCSIDEPSGSTRYGTPTKSALSEVYLK